MRLLIFILALAFAPLAQARMHWPENACLPAAMRVYAQLPSGAVCPWKRLISVRAPGAPMRHVYCVYRLFGRVYAYDVLWGSRRIYPKNFTAPEIARSLGYPADARWLDDR